MTKPPSAAAQTVSSSSMLHRAGRGAPVPAPEPMPLPDQRLRLLVGGNNFPLADPRPHTGEPVATATTRRRAVQTVFHDPDRPSRLTWPVLP